MNELALFAGAGGGLLASHLLGWNTIAAVELEPYPRSILLRRQQEGHLTPFPIWDDIRTFDPSPFSNHIDIITGGFPCQDISAAGKGRGLAGDRSGLWFEYLRCVETIRPPFVFAENSPLLRTRGLGTVIQGLDSVGYDVRWCVLGARHIGAPHNRDRMWILAHPKVRGLALRGQPTPTHCQDRQGRTHCCRGRGHGGRYALSSLPGQEPKVQPPRPTTTVAPPMGYPFWWGSDELGLDRVVDGVADRVDRTKAIGNGQVPAVAVLAFHILTRNLPA